MNNAVTWGEIEHQLHTLENSSDGYTLATRGTVTLMDGRRVFIKIGVDANTREWCQKEIAVYEYLESHGYPHIPKLLAYNDGRTAFALESLDESEGWKWPHSWDESRLCATLQTMDDLAIIRLNLADARAFATSSTTLMTNGCPVIAADTSHALRAKLEQSGYGELEHRLDYDMAVAKCEAFKLRNDSFVHNDVRQDNCAWDSKRRAVKLVDWSWAQYGDRRIDINSLLVHVYRSGLDVTLTHHRRLDEGALLWLAGYWLHAAITPIQPDGGIDQRIRSYQLASGVAALELAEKCI